MVQGGSFEATVESKAVFYRIRFVLRSIRWYDPKSLHSQHRYRVYDPATKKIQWHTSVVFVEIEPGGNLLRQLHEAAPND